MYNHDNLQNAVYLSSITKKSKIRNFLKCYNSVDKKYKFTKNIFFS